MRIAFLSIALAFSVPAEAKSNQADAYLDACFSAPSELDAEGKEKLFAVCITAFDGAIIEAQRTDDHSLIRRRLYWMQASQANAISVLYLLEREGGFTEYVCDIAKQGLQAWNQVDPKPGPEEEIQVPQTLVVAYRECAKFWR